MWRLSGAVGKVSFCNTTPYADMQRIFHQHLLLGPLRTCYSPCWHAGTSPWAFQWVLWPGTDWALLHFPRRLSSSPKGALRSLNLKSLFHHRQFVGVNSQQNGRHPLMRTVIRRGAPEVFFLGNLSNFRSENHLDFCIFFSFAQCLRILHSVSIW